MSGPATTEATTTPTTVAPLRIGPITVSPPVVLAPMAGITTPPFRRLCRGYGAGLYVSEMITARGLVEGNDKSWHRAAFDAEESPRSIQLYGADPRTVGEAVRRLVEEGHVDHVDLNLGCPVRKITRHGGGAALPARPALLRDLLTAAVRGAGTVPVTVKFRIGLDHDVVTYLDTGRIAEDAGCAAVALHGRTAAQLYSGSADWGAIARLKEAVRSIPVLGNGDVWCAADALRMQAETGCDGVVVGRGCLGRPWLFRDLADAYAGRAPAPPPRLGEVADTMARHLQLLCAHLGEERGVRDLRKHVPWYLTGYPVGGATRRHLATLSSRAELEDALAALDRALAPVPEAVDGPRGTQRGPQTLTLPDGWLARRDDPTPPGRSAELATSGG
ncbi:MAG: tRNA dihydrouridine synthase DusB [Acidimicrobiales bacterium]